jgi:multidrug efflux pump subunit AcrB
MNIGKFSVKNSVLMNILTVVILFLGAISFMRLPRALESDISFSWVFLSVVYPGVSAEEVEKNITVKIEEEIEDVEKIKKISSITREGMSFIQVEFEDGVSNSEFRRLYQDLRAEFDKVDLPDDALEPYIDDFSTSDFMSIVNVVLTGNVNDEIINKQAIKLQDKLLDIDDISKAEIVGGGDREIWINVDRDKIDAWGISLDQVSNAIRSRNVNVPGGTLETDTRSFILQTIGQLKDSRDFGKIIVRRQPGSSIRVSDVASVGSGYAENQYDVRFNGEKAISLVISKK